MEGCEQMRVQQEESRMTMYHTIYRDTNLLMRYARPFEIKNPILQVLNLGQNVEHKTLGHGPIIHHVNLHSVGA